MSLTRVSPCELDKIAGFFSVFAQGCARNYLGRKPLQEKTLSTTCKKKSIGPQKDFKARPSLHPPVEVPVLTLLEAGHLFRHGASSHPENCADQPIS